MLRRILCLGLLVCLTLGLAACNSDSKPSVRQSTVPDPEGGAKVLGPAGKGG